MAYLVLILGVTWLIRYAPPPGLWRYLAAASPAVPLVGVIVVLGLYLGEETDEFRRVQLVQAMLWSLGFTLTVTTVWGFLEDLAAAPHLSPTWIFPIFCLGMGVAQHLVRRWYR
jgi:xanthosine utilization system XapX-like protein